MILIRNETDNAFEAKMKRET